MTNAKDQEEDCPECGHPERLHPGRARSVTACAECIYEEDHDLRTFEAMCRRDFGERN